MQHHGLLDLSTPTFGRRMLVPRVCIAEGRLHIRAFLRDALEEVGFVSCECAGTAELDGILDVRVPDLIVFGPSMSGHDIGKMLDKLANGNFCGKILLVASRDSTAVSTVHGLSDALEITMLPSLFTPFDHEQLIQRVAGLLPAQRPPDPPIDVAEALHAGWLELWYQPKVDARTHSLRGVEALARVRHPAWGIVPPAYFIPDADDPHFRALSEFVVCRAMDDWCRIVDQHGPVEMAINLPVSFLQDPESVGVLVDMVQRHPSLNGLIIEIQGVDAVDHLDLIGHAARQLRRDHIAFSVDDLGEEWPSLMGLSNFPFVELKVDRQFVTGCADDRLKRTVCRRILDLADSYGACTVAEGVESRDDFLAVREMDFDLAQGFLFGRPMPVDKLARRLPLDRPPALT